MCTGGFELLYSKSIHPLVAVAQVIYGQWFDPWIPLVFTHPLLIHWCMNVCEWYKALRRIEGGACVNGVNVACCIESFEYSGRVEKCNIRISPFYHLPFSSTYPFQGCGGGGGLSQLPQSELFSTVQFN